MNKRTECNKRKRPPEVRKARGWVEAGSWATTKEVLLVDFINQIILHYERNILQPFDIL